jgi:hypothetical protein
MGHIKSFNVAVMLGSCSREVIGSNLGWDIVYFDWSVSWFCLLPSGKYRDSPSNRPRPYPLQFIVHISYKIIFHYLSQFFLQIFNAVMLQTHTRKVLDSNIGRKTGHPGWNLPWLFCSVSLGRPVQCLDYTTSESSHILSSSSVILTSDAV